MSHPGARAGCAGAGVTGGSEAMATMVEWVGAGRCGACGHYGPVVSQAGETVCADDAACGKRLRAGQRRGSEGEERIDTEERDALEWVAMAAKALRAQPKRTEFWAELGEAIQELDRVRRV